MRSSSRDALRQPISSTRILSVSQSSTWSPNVKTSVASLQDIVSTLIIGYFICIIKCIVLGKVVFLGNIVCVAYRFISICDVTHRTSEAGNGETGPSTLSSLVGNFPYMPQSPAFTHPSSKGLGPRTPSQVSRFPRFSGCPSRSGVAKQHLTITSTFCARLLLLRKLPQDLFITPKIAPSHLSLLQKPTPMNYSSLRKLPPVIYYYSRNLPL